MFGKHKKLREDFNKLVDGLRKSKVVSDCSLLLSTRYFNKIMGSNGPGIIEKIENLERQVKRQDEKIKLIMEHFNIETHIPECKEILQDKK